jgi:UPF0042 nucleotide-binding protein
VSDARQRVVLVSGLSGAGKASILRALEDIGFEAIDNPPLTFIEEMVARADPYAGPANVAPSIAVGVDARSRGFRAEQVLSTLARLRANPALRAELLFATADEQALLRRFTETRRRHPLAPAGLVTSGIAAERSLIGSLQEAADLVIDTTDLPLAGLRQLIEARFAGDGATSGPPLAVSLISFGFPGGLPREADLVFDARFLRNPHYDPALKPLTGLDSAVGAYVEADADFAEFFGRIEGLLGLLLPRFVQEGKKYATVAVGCTGGRHRSVHIIEKLAATLIRTGWRVTITHRELARQGIAERTRHHPAARAESPAPALGPLS